MSRSMRLVTLRIFSCPRAVLPGTDSPSLRSPGDVMFRQTAEAIWLKAILIL